MLLVYGNNYWFMPRLLMRNKNSAYLISMGVLLLTLVCINYYMQNDWLFTYFYEQPFWTAEDGYDVRIATFLNIFAFQASILGAGAGIKLFKLFLQDRFRLQNMEILQLESELSHLKEQLNPHFLFNALNNIYVLTKIDPEKAQETIELLSELLRYQLYQSDQSRVPLADELVYLEAFLAMEKIRKKDMQVSFVVEGDTRDKWIAPLMLITFIENAVKHGISAAGEGWIAIKVRVDGDLLDLEVENSLNPEAATHSPGIGLQNLQRRLALSYPDTHKIRAETQRDRYLATLSLELDR
jgi:LytS/YehU family sensor histidine kinase